VIYTLGSRKPAIHESCFIAENATIIGSVVLERDASIWFNAVLRGDNDLITVREESNIQDGAVLHTDDDIQLEVGPRVTVGHKAMLHGCRIGEGSLVGIGATILNNAVIGKHCIIGAHALITEGKEIPDRSLVVGAPGRVIRTVSDEVVEKLEWSAEHYVKNGRRFRQDLQPFPTSRSTST
jgi:carbonic anhydrase/acetyltransferase-like protein (isoleucine patch superfamily)